MGRPHPGRHRASVIGAGCRRDRGQNQKERSFLESGALPPNPRDFTLYSQDCWTPGRAALVPGESRLPSRRSGCVSAEPYPPFGCNQYSRFETSTRENVYTKFLTPPRPPAALPAPYLCGLGVSVQGQRFCVVSADLLMASPFVKDAYTSKLCRGDRAVRAGPVWFPLSTRGHRLQLISDCHPLTESRAKLVRSTLRAAISR